MSGEQLEGHIDTLVMAILEDGPAHGYAVIESLREPSDGVFDLPEGTIYPALHRLERVGRLASRREVIGAASDASIACRPKDALRCGINGRAGASSRPPSVKYSGCPRYDCHRPVTLAELASSLHVGRRERARILSEVRDHLDDSTALHELAGEHSEPAAAHALQAFGPVQLTVTHFTAEAGTRTMRRAPAITPAAGAAFFAGLVIAGRSQPHPPVPKTATLPTQIPLFAAVLAFQVAVVAGICAASRAVALRSTPTPHGDDRQFVRRAATISGGALCVAAMGWR